MKWLARLPVALALLAVAGALLFVAVNVLAAGARPSGPVDVVWDREVCAHCRMHIGEPAFAAQLQTSDGRVLSFDDPGCAFQLIDQSAPEVAALYFRHCREDRWIAATEAAFVRVAQSPMGFGYGAVVATDTDAIPFEAVRADVLRGENR